MGVEDGFKLLVVFLDEDFAQGAFGAAAHIEGATFPGEGITVPTIGQEIVEATVGGEDGAPKFVGEGVEAEGVVGQVGAIGGGDVAEEPVVVEGTSDRPGVTGEGLGVGGVGRPGTALPGALEVEELVEFGGRGSGGGGGGAGEGLSSGGRAVDQGQAADEAAHEAASDR